jgi:hypothetical protein
MIKVITKEEILESRPKNLSVVPFNKKVSSPDVRKLKLKQLL